MTVEPTGAQPNDLRRFNAFAAQPAGLSTLFFVELWERFSYYGMRALLTLFMVAPVAAGGMGLATSDAAMIYGNYTMSVYLLPLAGGYIADRFLGLRQSVLWGGAIITAGHFTLALPATWSFFAGLVLVAVGTGLFKPCISGLVGALYSENDGRRDAGFSLFYMGINIGALAAPIITGFLAQSAWFKGWLEANGFDPAGSWHWGFGAAGVGMALGLALFAWRTRGALGAVGSAPATKIDREAWRNLGLIVGLSALILGVILLSDVDGFKSLRLLFLAAPVAVVVWFARAEQSASGMDGQKIAAIGVLFIASMVFWAVFEQAGLGVALFADQLTADTVGGFQVPSAWYQSLNPLFVILLAPIFALAWTRLGDRQPSSPVKFALGLILLSLSFFLMVPAAQLTVAGKVSPLWLVGLFFLQTAGELLLSPVGLSTITKLAPARFVAFALGIWFLSASWGSKLAGILSSDFDATDPEALTRYFLYPAVMVAVAGVLLWLVSPWVRKLMGDVR